MQALRRIAFFLFALSGIAFADTYTGVLIDAACAAQEHNAPCNPTRATTRFALIVAGSEKPRTLPLDPAGNAKAAMALTRGDSGDAPSPGEPQSTSIIATVVGTTSGGELKVDAIRVD